MNLVEKRDFIHSHLHEVGETIIDEVYRKIYSQMKNENSIAGSKQEWRPMLKDEFISRIKESEAQIERGEYLTIEELEKESDQW